MEVPLEITYRGVAKTDELDDIIRRKADRLERICRPIISCRVSVESPQGRRTTGNPFRVRIDLRVPPSKEIVVTQTTGTTDNAAPLPRALRRAFDAAERRLKVLVAKRRYDVKVHAENEANAIVTKLFREDGFGFIRALAGHQVYFHRNSVLNQEFDRMRIGAAVRFVEQQGDDGPQASTVQLVNPTGARNENS